MSFSLSAIPKCLFLRCPRPQPIRRSFRLTLDALEDRYAPAVLGALTLTNDTFYDNNAGGNGGAVYTGGGTLTINNGMFSNNQSNDGGAVASLVTNDQGTAAVSVMGCLFTNNKATNAGGMGGGLYVNHTTSGTGAAALIVANDTFYQDGADYGGGIALNNSASNRTTNTVTLTSLTVNSNYASTFGGGLWISAATGVPGLRPQLTNNIIAGNNTEMGPAAGPDVFGNALSLGFNLIGDTDGGNTVWLSNDIVGTSTNPQSPGLAPGGPTDNGGLTFTIKLATGSAAYEHGNPALGNGPMGQNTTDQRGYKRQLKVSIGAYDPDALP